MTSPSIDAVTAAGQPAHFSMPFPAAPRLGLALLKARAGSHPAFQTPQEADGWKWVLTGNRSSAKKSSTAAPSDEEAAAQQAAAEAFDADLRKLLEHISARLEAGLLEPWCSPYGYDYRYHMLVETGIDRDGLAAKFGDAASPRNTPDERWARVVSELSVFAAYFGVGQAHGFFVSPKPKGYDKAPADDGKFYKVFPRVYPLMMACQHLATYAALARGITIDQMTGGDGVAGLGCVGGVVDYGAFDASLSAKFACGDQQHRRVSQLLKAGLGPGDVVVFNPEGPKSGNQPSIAGQTTHIGVALRTADQRIQWIDTGVLVGDDEASGSEAGTTDHSWDYNRDPANPSRPEGSIPAADFLVAFGKLKKVGDGELVKALEAAAKARPLGFVRLMLFDVRDPNSPQLLFASKLLHMKYNLARLIWSLRALPAEGVQAVWTTYFPNHKWVDDLMQDRDPLPKPADICVEDAAVKNQPTLTRANVIVSAAGGGVDVFRNNSGTWRQNFGAAKLSGSPLFRDHIPLVVAHPTEKDANAEYHAGNWALGQDQSYGRKSFGLRYVRRPGEARGALDEDKTGVAFFDP